MSRMTITLDVDSPAQEQLVRQYHALLQELNDLAHTAPEGQVIDLLEGAVLERGRDTLRAALQEAVQQRIEAAEKRALLRPSPRSRGGSRSRVVAGVASSVPSDVAAGPRA
jgi:hypothetical protein